MYAISREFIKNTNDIKILEATWIVVKRVSPIICLGSEVDGKFPRVK